MHYAFNSRQFIFHGLVRPRCHVENIYPFIIYFVQSLNVSPFVFKLDSDRIVNIVSGGGHGQTMLSSCVTLFITLKHILKYSSTIVHYLASDVLRKISKTIRKENLKL